MGAAQALTWRCELPRPPDRVVAMNAMETITSREPSTSIYAALVRSLREVGEHDVEVKQTSLHLTRGRAFAGVHPRTTGLLVNVVLNRELVGARVAKTSQVSRSRWHNEVLLSEADHVDAELQGWLTEAYDLAG